MKRLAALFLALMLLGLGGCAEQSGPGYDMVELNGGQVQ